MYKNNNHAEDPAVKLRTVVYNWYKLFYLLQTILVLLNYVYTLLINQRIFT